MEGAGRHNISGRPDPDGSGSKADHGVAPPTMRARPKMVELPREGVSRWGIRSAVDHLCRTSTRGEEGLTGKPRCIFAWQPVDGLTAEGLGDWRTWGSYVRARGTGCYGQSIEVSCGASVVAIIDISSL